jgi:hypothetical protein
MTEDEKQGAKIDRTESPAAAARSPEPLSAKVHTPYFKTASGEDTVNPVLRKPSDISAIKPPDHVEAGYRSEKITWRDRLKGLWFAASVFVMAQSSQPEPPPPTPISHSAMNPQANGHSNTGTEYKYSAEPSEAAIAMPQFDFRQANSQLYLVVGQQPEQIIQIVVQVQTDKPSDAEIKDATDYLRQFQHELYKKALSPEHLADKVVSGGEAVLGIALFKARKKIRANTHNRLVIWLCDTFDRIAKAFEEDDNKELPEPRKRPIGFLADRINCSPEDTVAVLKLTPCAETEPGRWEYRGSS